MQILNSILAVALSLGLPLAGSDGEPTLEYRVKAAFLLNFARFVEWPGEAFSTPDAPMSICVVGDDPFGSTLDQIVEGETIGGRKLVVKRVRRPVASRSCQLVYFAKSEKNFDVQEWGHGVLTVGEEDGFLKSGGTIAFVIDDGKVRFDVSKRSFEASRLKASSKLLRVARSVEK